ncbi:MAG TPA: hypothetical protein VL728_13835 [Cyclobacteriaceae bacterium]|jgi:Tfp pilus assembly protein PilF|nr:hypothetical protein [Cyclobacteriaceae bacterium]
MLSIQFWKYWQKPYQFLFWLLACCFLLALIMFWRGYFLYPAPVIGYDHYQQLETIETPSHAFSVGVFNLTVPADSYVILENIYGSTLQPNVVASYFFLATLVLSFVVFISIVPDLGRYRFLMAMGIVILFLTSLQTESLEIFGLQNQTVTIALILFYGILAFYFHAQKTEIGFIKRFFVFGVVTVMIGLGITFFAKTTMPWLHLSATGLLVGIVVCLIFIFTVAHEMVAVFVSVITKSLRSKRSLQHFLILTSIYLVNVFLIFASKMGIIKWSFFSVSPFFLMTASAVLGIWGFRQRQPQHENILDDEPQRIYFFFSLAIAALGTSAFFVSTASDMMIDALEDYIIACHFGVGLIFMLYIIANFAPMLKNNLSVYKVLYKPETMPLFTFRIMAVIATFAVLSWAVSWKTYLNQVAATYYDAHGDLYLAKNDERMAENFYLKSLKFRNQNLHAHYALASIYESRSESNKVRRHYEDAITWTPSVPLYLNLAYAFSSRGDELEAMLTLDEGKKKFPKSGEILNALGLSFLKLKQKDSAVHNLRGASLTRETQSIGEVNAMAVVAEFKGRGTGYSPIQWSNAKNNAKFANELALANLDPVEQAIGTEGSFSSDSSLNIYEAMTLCNYLLNQKQAVDTTLIRKALDLSRKETNEAFAEQLLVSSAHALYAKGLIREALQMAREMAYRANEGKYFSLLGLWLLEQNNPALASVYLKSAAEKSHPGALYLQAIAEAEAGDLDQSFLRWDSLRKSADKTTAGIAEKMANVLKTKPEQMTSLTEDEKYFFCKYKIPLTDKKLFEKTIGAMTDGPLRAQAIIDRSKKLFYLDESTEAALVFNQLHTAYSRNINQQAANLRIMLAADKDDWRFVQENLLSTEVSINQKIYLEASLAAQQGREKEAKQIFEYLSKADNYFDEGVVASVRFFSKDPAYQMKNLSLLVDGLLAKPFSVKILKEHALLAADMGFIEAAQDSLDKLQTILPKESFEKFVAAHRDYFGRN